MRLVAWNCCTGPLDRKLAALQGLAPDIAVVPECPRIPHSGTTAWTGANPRKGLGVFAADPWRLAPVKKAPRNSRRYVLPLTVSGPEPFLLLALWAQQHRTDRYVRGVHRTVTAYEHLIRTFPTVILGDFNSNTIWDHEHPAGRSHTALVERLASLGLASAYHVHHGEPQGGESRPTFFEYRHAHRPYHIDYCFLPTAWRPRISNVAVGAHPTWARLSDHMPLTVDLRPAAD